MMELVPPVGWADVATKRDLDHLDRRMDAFERRMDAFERRMERLESELASQTRLLFFSMLGAVFSATSLAFAAARFA